MEDSKLYGKITESAFKVKISYICWDGSLNLAEEVVFLIKKSVNSYRYKIAIITKNCADKDEISKAIKKSGLLPYQVNRVEFIPLTDISKFKKDPTYDFDLVIPYKLESHLTVDEIDTIVNLIRVNGYLAPKVVFVCKENDSFIRAAVERFGENSFTSIMKLIKNKSKAKFILHELMLDDKERKYCYTIKRNISTNPTTINEEYPSYIKNITKYNSVYNTIIYVKCNQREFYDLIQRDIDYYSKRIRNFISEKACKEDRLALKKIILTRKKFLAGIKNEIIKDFLLKNPDKKRLIYCSDNTQTELFTQNNFVSTKQSKDTNQDLTLKYNNGVIKDLGVIGFTPDYLTFDSTEEVIFPYINGLESEVLSEVSQINLDIKVHLFYFSQTIEEDNLLKISDPFDEDLFIYYEEFIKS